VAERVWTILELLNESASFLQGRGIEAPRVNAEVLLGHVLGMRRVDLYARFDTRVEGPALDAFRELVRRRLARVPLQYLTGVAEFYSRSFLMRERVFIPRPETEVLVERALAELASSGVNGSARIAEIGVGTGAILITLLLERPGAVAIGVDVSPDALALAQENAERHAVGERLRLVEGNLLDPLAGEEPGSFDLVVANPPYLDEAVLGDLAPEVRDHEPHAALVAAGEGYDALRAIIGGAWRWLRPGGVLALEIGETQAGGVRRLLEDAAEYDRLALHKDFAGKDRVFVARRSGG
jgi:release factor glutamine methyltransferase